MTSRTRNVARAIQMAWSAGRPQFLVCATLALLAAAVPTLEVWLGKRLIDRIIAHDEHTAVWTAIFLGIVFGANRVMGGIRVHVQDAFAQRVVAHVMHQFLEKASSIDIATSTIPTGTIAPRARAAKPAGCLRR